MKVHGIEFKHRRPEVAEWVAKDYAQFTAFATLCASRGVEKLVKGVFFDSKWQGFNIDADEGLEHTSAHQAIKECAEQTLPQFSFLGTYGEWSRAEPLGPYGDDESGDRPF